jgi:predicted TIM-barrel fold metal-dependent hydrolase
MVLISIDDHVIEPPNLFERHVPEKYRDQAPKVVHNPDGTDGWIFQGERVGAPMGLNAVASWPQEEKGWDPAGFAEIRPGAYDIHERVRDMNANGVFQSMCFPTMAGFSARIFLDPPDRDLSLIMLKAYNDWHVDEWCGTYPGRFIPLAVVPVWDQDAMVAEVRRMAAKGCHAFTFSENPEKTGFPSLHNEWWDPFWAACADEGTIVCFHIGSSSEIPVTSVESPVDVTLTLMPVNIVQVAADLIWSDFLRRYPLKVSLSEGGIGWVPYFLERLDHSYRTHKAWTGADFGDKLASEVMMEHVVLCFISDPVGARLARDIGVDRITVEIDYPHSDTTWPHSIKLAHERLHGLPPEVQYKILRGNAEKLYRFTPAEPPA